MQSHEQGNNKAFLEGILLANLAKLDFFIQGFNEIANKSILKMQLLISKGGSVVKFSGKLLCRSPQT